MRRSTLPKRLIRELPAVVALALLAGCSDNSLPTASDVTGALRPGDSPLANVSIGPSALDLVVPNLTPYVEGTDYEVANGSGSGDVTATLVPVDIAISLGAGPVNLNPENTSTSGCEATDFAGFPVGAVALIQRGTCSFDAKVANALAAGASAVIIFNEGQVGRTDAGFIDLSGSYSSPVVATSFAVGVDLYGYALGLATIRVLTTTVESIASATIDAAGTVDPSTGAATVGGSLSCDGVSTVEVRVTVVQQQKARRVPTTVTATQDVIASCNEEGSWTASVAPLSGAFVNGTAVVTALPLSELASGAEATVKLTWSKKVK